MANTYTSLHYHIIFSTKNRFPYFKPKAEQRVWAYLGGIARPHRMMALQVGGMEDHLHALVLGPPTFSPSQLAQYLKGGSSSWIHQQFPDWLHFAWQDGYGAFTVSKSSLARVIRYIRNQRQHHQRKTFQQEYLELLKEHGIEYGERYLWG